MIIFLAADYVDRHKIDTPRGFPGKSTEKQIPTAHEASQTLFNVKDANKGNSKGTSVMFMTFGQLLDHDIALTPRNNCPKIEQVPFLPFQTFLHASIKHIKTSWKYYRKNYDCLETLSKGVIIWKERFLQLQN